METQWELVQLELKYCERCGGLWLRRQGVSDVCCASCAELAPEFRMVRRSKRRPILPVNRNGLASRLQLVAPISRPGGTV